MGGGYDALMLRQQQPPEPGRYSGTAVPHVSGPSPSSYTLPKNWADPAVSGRDLIVQRDVLRQVAGDLARMADQLQATLSACAAAAGPAAAAAGGWHEAQQLARAMAKAHTGVTQFTGELRQAHHDMATRLSVSADRYDAAEQQITGLIYAAADPSATIIGSGGKDTPVQPGYGQSWTPEQRAAYYRMQRLENIPGNSGPDWTGTFLITEDAGFTHGGTAGYTWQQVRGLLAATNPAAISAAATVYGQLASTLTEIAGGLAGHGQTLAANWGGSTAVTAVSQVQQLYQTAVDLQANTWSAQQALQWYGPVLATFRDSTPQPTSSDPADVSAADQAAQQRLAALNSHIETAYYQMPGAVNKNLPPPLATTSSGGSGTGTGAGSGGGGYTGGGYAGTGAGAVTTTGSGATGSHLASSAAPLLGTTQLAGFSPAGAADPTSALPGSAFGGVPAGAGSGGIGVLPPLPGGVTGAGLGAAARGTAADPAAGEFGPGGEPAPGQLGARVTRGAFRNLALSESEEQAVAASEAELGESALGADAASGGLAAAEEAGAANAAAMPGALPTAGGGAGGMGQGVSERASQYWAGEEEATWGADAAPAEIAGAEGAAAEDGVGSLMPGGAAGRGQQRDRGRLAWLGEDDDFWGAGGVFVPPVLGG